MKKEIFTASLQIGKFLLMRKIEIWATRAKRQKTNQEILEDISLRLGTLQGKLEAKMQKGNIENILTPIYENKQSNTLRGHSTAEMFNRIKADNSKWVVDGYMKVGQVNLLVAGSGVGKTILMIQIALAVAKGTTPEFLPPEHHASEKLNVVYYHLEHFEDELPGKYGDGKVLLEIGTNITWVFREDLSSATIKGLIEHLKDLANRLEIDTLVCIDPATKLDGYKHSDFIKGVEDAMAIARGNGVVMTIVATIHLAEIKDWTVLTTCDIKGGDKGLQQAGSVTALRKERTNVEVYRFLQCLKEPKGSPKPFNGDVLVMKTVHKKLDDKNKYLYYQYDSIKPEVQARPKKPKVQADEVSSTETSSKAPMAPNQKVTPEKEQEMKEMLSEKMPQKEIAATLHLSEKTISRYKTKFKNEAT